MSSVIRARNVYKSFGDINAVDGIDLDLKAGTILGLIGPNGAGKTTLLRALLGLTQYGGELEVLDDLTDKGLEITEFQVRKQMDKVTHTAREQILNESEGG